MVKPLPSFAVCTSGFLSHPRYQRMGMFAKDDSTGVSMTVHLELIPAVRFRICPESPGSCQIITIIPSEDYHDSRMLNEHLSVQESPAIALEQLPV
jgi:hypothetical protein